MALDTEFVRGQFPAFSDPTLKDLAFFENAGGSYACAPVIDRLTRFYTTRKMQPYGPSAPSQAGGAEMDEARSRLAAMMGVETDELSFGPSTTQNTYVLAQAFAQWLSPGEKIIVTDQDHEANSGPWRRLTGRGLRVVEWKMDPETGHLDPADLDGLLDDTVRLVCFPHCSNIVGEINDVRAIVDKVHAAGAVVCVDGVSYAPHGLPDVAKLGADIYLFSSYKTYGPHQGLMVIRRALGEALPNQGHHFNGGTLYKRFTPAGPDHAQIAACAGMADYIDALYAHHIAGNSAPAARAAAVHDLMRAQEIALLEPLLDYLSTKNSLRLLGPTAAQNRAPTVAVLSSRPGAEIAADLAPHGIMADGGDFYAGRNLRAQGIDPGHGVLRMSFVHYTSASEVDRLITALDQVL
ncbi:MAG: aminotransferase class V-fold PLP-dependent enzyme [Rhodobacteraceae bacterium]|nr:aminotransferase class V-fold PLP-dependent enzyme [Alphaproteobacteria bacterium]NNK68263.1 aminotransferase class V-fold PLP-dependent enzyme [Paracoccaceae bacterium]